MSDNEEKIMMGSCAAASLLIVGLLIGIVFALIMI
jgi:hypothetical protein